LFFSKIRRKKYGSGKLFIKFKNNLINNLPLSDEPFYKNPREGQRNGGATAVINSSIKVK
jgi:hypothetical protein